MKLEEKIFTLRKKNGLSQDDLAQQLGVTRQAVYKWESGNALPELDKIKALAKIFSVSFDYLLDDTIEEYDTNKDNEKISYRPIYLLGDKQNLMQGDIDHGYIKERDSRNTMSKVIFSKRKSLAESYMKKVGATEVSFFSEEETLAYFYDSNQQTIGIYYGNGIQFVCPIENLVSISLNGGATNVVNSRSTMLGISNAGIGIGSMPTVSVQGSYPIDLTIMFHDGDIIKDFSFKIMTAVTYLYFEQSRSNVEIFNSILRNRVADRIGKIKTKIEALICNSAVLVGEKAPEINVDLYSGINAEAKTEYREFISKLKNEIYEEKDKSKANWIKLGIWFAAFVAPLLVPQMILVPLALIIGLIPANIAKHMDRSYIRWWMYGSFLFPVAMIHLLYLKIKKKYLESEGQIEKKQKNIETFERIVKIVTLLLCAAGMITLSVEMFLQDVGVGIFWLVCQILGFIVAFRASRRGRNIVLWWIYGTFLLVVAAIHLCIIIDLEEE